MTYLPTKEEIEEMGFSEGKYEGTYAYFLDQGDTSNGIAVHLINKYWSIFYDHEICHISIYQKSKEDIVTLIRLFTNN